MGDAAGFAAKDSGKSPQVDAAKTAPGSDVERPRSFTNDLLNLQRSIGNEAVVALLRSPSDEAPPNDTRPLDGFVQRRLKVGRSTDRYEQEADNVSRLVVAALRRRATASDDAPLETTEDSPRVSRRESSGPAVEVGAGGGELTHETDQAIERARRGGDALGAQTRTAMEAVFGADFGDVRVHEGPEAAALNERVQADAFTVGNDIFFRHGLPDAASSTGQELLAHELTHTIQQGASKAIRDDVALRARQSRSLDRSFVNAKGDGGLSGVVQRHSSWEHNLLGDAKPEELGKIGTWQDLIKQTWPVEDPEALAAVQEGGMAAFAAVMGGMPLPTTPDIVAKVTIPGTDQPIEVTKGDVMHLLADEMARLKNWQVSSPTEASTDKPLEPVKVGERLVVRLPSKDNQEGELLTYGELNTLADFYGNYDAMVSAEPKARHQVIQSVRKETYLRLREIYEQLENSLTGKEQGSDSVKGAQGKFEKEGLGGVKGAKGVYFKGAMTSIDYVSGQTGQLHLLLGDNTKAGAVKRTVKDYTVGQSIGTEGAENQYAAGLARNACHFVPESWLAWADCHAKAIELARKAHEARSQIPVLEARLEGFRKQAARASEQTQASADQGDKGGVDGNEWSKAQLQLEQAKKDASELANQALLHNGFGDHYLQDSFAAGHMINKTQIMQWYVEWMDKNHKADYFKDANWRKAQNMAYLQPGLADAGQYDKSKVKGVDATQNANAPRNPQSVENLADRPATAGQSGVDWTTRFAALGLKIPDKLRDPNSDERVVLEWWQKQTASGGKQKLKGSAFPKFPGVGVPGAVANLVKFGVAWTDEEFFGGSLAKRGRYLREGTDELAGKERFPSTTFVLREEYVPKTNYEKLSWSERAAKTAMSAITGADKSQIHPHLDGAAKTQSTDSMERFTAGAPGKRDANVDDSAYQRMLEAVTYGDFVEFMSSALIQKATNALHNIFCLKGLDVKTKKGEEAFRVYGDDAMFSETSSAGVKASGETANMSRDAILGVINTGQEGENTTANIVERFPSVVQLDDGTEVAFEDWHNPKSATKLKAFCEKSVFEDSDRFIPGAVGQELGKITKDADKVKVHGSEAF